jgi:hypothetical protein
MLNSVKEATLEIRCKKALTSSDQKGKILRESNSLLKDKIIRGVKISFNTGGTKNRGV